MNGIRMKYFSAFLSTLSLRRATRFSRSGRMTRRYFYPRSPCGERPTFIVYSITGKCISIHALLAESDDVACGDRNKLRDFYPRSPCGERLLLMWYQCNTVVFLSTLSLRRATKPAQPTPAAVQFLSTLSLRRATPLPWPATPRQRSFLSTLSLRRATTSCRCRVRPI